jgi:glycosyltransferase involved in cell wall biosynthesis
VVGGAESVVREIAAGLAGRGWDVEVLTTCAVDHFTWANDLPEGTTEEDGATIRRFATVHHRSRRALAAQRSIDAGAVPPIDDQWTWVNGRFTAPGLHRHLLRHGAGFDTVVFAPYLFWTTTACVGAVPRAVVMPCLHDETYARLDVIRPVLGDPASVWFLSEPEHQLAHCLGQVYPRHTVTGAGVDVPAGYDPAGFRRRHGLTRPFVLYAGRREAGKGWDWLLATVAEAARLGAPDLDLVTIGVPPVAVDRAGPVRVIDLGFLPAAERNDAFAAALAYLQPSRMESFSRTVMEAWLAGTPVLVIDGSEVVAWHCERSGGGARFADGAELATRLRRLTDDPAGAAAMAGRGRRYVLDYYAWPVVLDRMEADLTAVAAGPTSVAGSEGPGAQGTPPGPTGAARVPP